MFARDANLNIFRDIFNSGFGSDPLKGYVLLCGGTGNPHLVPASDWVPFDTIELSSSSHQLKYWDAQLLKRPRNEKRRHDILLCQAIIVTFATNTKLGFVWANWLGPVVIQFVGSVLRVTQLLYLLLKCECHLLILF